MSGLTKRQMVKYAMTDKTEEQIDRFLEKLAKGLEPELGLKWSRIAVYGICGKALECGGTCSMSADHVGGCLCEGLPRFK